LQLREKERKAIEERDPAISQAKRRRQMIASLPKLFNMIHFLFQSIKQSVITKEELMHKIIASQCDIVDRSKPLSSVDMFSVALEVFAHTLDFCSQERF
jgi:chromatin licensing and DNA replication factor 1